MAAKIAGFGLSKELTEPAYVAMSMYGTALKSHAVKNLVNGILLIPERHAELSGSMGMARESSIITNPC